MPDRPAPIALIILDGWGHDQNSHDNPMKTTQTPCFDDLFRKYPYTLLQASGEAVGLPKGQIGNSEVGHLHLGAGRDVPQDLTRINKSIQQGEFDQNTVLKTALATAKNNGSAVHVIGLLSPGGVHSHQEHLFSMLKMTAKGKLPTFVHAILDGRDTPPQSAIASLTQLDALLSQHPKSAVASTIGRYYAMDRDQRWDRTKTAYDLLTEGQAAWHASSAEQALEQAYARGETDEFVQATTIHPEGTDPVRMRTGDVVIFMNFRADRAKQLCHALMDTDFDAFERKNRPKLASLVTLTQYDGTLEAQVAYPCLSLEDTLASFLSHQGLHQLHMAETEKYAHVTYFFNGGVEAPYPGEDRILIPSPKVATYDLQPEMSAHALTDRLVEAIFADHYDVIICNYANLDMVGHTGKIEAAAKAITTIDTCLERVCAALLKVGGEALITADHGNIEQMYDPKTKQSHTAHTTNKVPLLYVGNRPFHFKEKNGTLADVAPTLLYLMQQTPPKAMTGHNLLKMHD